MEIEVYNKINDMTSIETLGNWIAKSGMFGCEKIEQGQILALQCITEKKPPLELDKTYHIIQGKLSKRTDAMLADFRKIGGKVKWVKFDATEARAVFSLDGDSTEIAYSMQDAQRAGLNRKGSGWDKHPAAMLRARLISTALRMLAPEIVCGTYAPEEIADIKPVSDPKPLLKQAEKAEASEDMHVEADRKTAKAEASEDMHVEADRKTAEDFVERFNGQTFLEHRGMSLDNQEDVKKILQNIEGFESAVKKFNEKNNEQ